MYLCIRKRGNAPFFEGPFLCPRKVKRSLKGLHRQNEVVQEAMACAVFRDFLFLDFPVFQYSRPLGRRNEPSIFY